MADGVAEAEQDPSIDEVAPATAPAAGRAARQDRPRRAGERRPPGPRPRRRRGRGLSRDRANAPAPTRPAADRPDADRARLRRRPRLRQPVRPADRPPRPRAQRLLGADPPRHAVGRDRAPQPQGDHPLGRPELGLRRRRAEARPGDLVAADPGPRDLLRRPADGPRARRRRPADRRSASTARRRSRSPTATACSPGLDRDQPVWMSHGDSITRLPEGFTSTAQTDSTAFAGLAVAGAQPLRHPVPSRGRPHAEGPRRPAQLRRRHRRRLADLDTSQLHRPDRRRDPRAGQRPRGRHRVEDDDAARALARRRSSRAGRPARGRPSRRRRGAGCSRRTGTGSARPLAQPPALPPRLVQQHGSGDADVERLDAVGERDRDAASHVLRTSGRTPFPSAPKTSATPPVRSASHIVCGASAAAAYDQRSSRLISAR